MKVLNVIREQRPSIEYNVEIEVKGVIYIFQFTSWDYELSHEQILERYKQDIDGDYVIRKTV